uniref:Uncharacterized protein n=1 Tax=Utricularia reniformis TaxID=192314 RepID=A0A1Y0AYZ2_9LAMI|nr:hypothetical protein AEK19_MT1535 [Utricularia reniformis]ART30386.1 hypothetical protein AEK19_MT1535 [Utricularia reniformis]
MFVSACNVYLIMDFVYEYSIQHLPEYYFLFLLLITNMIFRIPGC